ncbi:MAG: diacylglycerol kinase family protein [Pseudomonadota bacterium]
MSHFSSRRLRVVFNPTAGRRKQSRIEDVIARLRANGCHVDVCATTGPGHAIDLARQAATDGDIDVVVAAGGDGTISECATGLLQALEDGSVSFEALPALGILPMGTANVLAMDLGLVTLGGVARRKITRTLMHGRVRTLQVGQVENAIERRAFVMMVGAGFDGAAVGAVSARLKKRFGKFAYVKAGIEAIFAGPGEGGVLRRGEDTLRQSSWIIITNGQHYAGGYRLTRRTNLTRDTLAAFAVKGLSRFSVLKANTCLGLGLFDTKLNAEAHMGERFRIETPGRHCMVQVDGDYFGLAPVDVSIAPHAIKFLIPNGDNHNNVNTEQERE